jgi:hypothetical protein
LQGKASTHPINVSTSTSSNFELGTPPTTGHMGKVQLTILTRVSPLPLCPWGLETLLDLFSGVFHMVALSTEPCL